MWGSCSGGVSTVEPVGVLKPSLATRWLEGWKRRIIYALGTSTFELLANIGVSEGRIIRD